MGGVHRQLLEAFFSRIKQNDVVFSTKLKLLKYEVFNKEGVLIAPSRENDVLRTLKPEQLQLIYGTLAELGIPKQKVKGFEGELLGAGVKRTTQSNGQKKAFQANKTNTPPPQKSLTEALKTLKPKSKPSAVIPVVPTAPKANTPESKLAAIQQKLEQKAKKSGQETPEVPVQSPEKPKPHAEPQEHVQSSATQQEKSQQPTPQQSQNKQQPHVAQQSKPTPKKAHQAAQQSHPFQDIPPIDDVPMPQDVMQPPSFEGIPDPEPTMPTSANTSGFQSQSQGRRTQPPARKPIPKPAANLPEDKPESFSNPTSLSDIEQRRKNKAFEEKKSQVLQRPHVKGLLQFLGNPDFQETGKKS